MKQGSTRAWWWVLAVGLVLDPLSQTTVFPLLGFWEPMLGRAGFVVLGFSVGGVQPLLVAASAAVLLYLHWGRVSKRLRAVAAAAFALNLAVALVGAFLAARMILNVVGTSRLPVSPTIRATTTLPIAAEPVRDVLISSLLVGLAAVVVRSSSASRALMLLLLAVAATVMVRMLDALPQNWFILDQAIGLPDWSKPPNWISIRWWVGFGPDRTANRVLAIAMATLAIAAMWVSGAISRRGLFPLAGHCPTCGYDQHGLALGATVCPECGHSVPAAAA